MTLYTLSRFGYLGVNLWWWRKSHKVAQNWTYFSITFFLDNLAGLNFFVGRLHIFVLLLRHFFIVWQPMSNFLNSLKMPVLYFCENWLIINIQNCINFCNSEFYAILRLTGKNCIGFQPFFCPRSTSKVWSLSRKSLVPIGCPRRIFIVKISCSTLCGFRHHLGLRGFLSFEGICPIFIKTINPFQVLIVVRKYYP